MIMIFYDTETFKYDWLGVFIDMIKQSETVIVNNPEKLKNFYEEHKDDIWVGFNNVRYDQFIIKGILLGLDPKWVNDKIIIEEINGHFLCKEFRKIKMINYDCLVRKDRSLKQLEGFMGANIHETSVPFDIDRPLTQDEIDLTVKYCRNDVEQTIEVFMKQINEFNASLGLIKQFNDVLTIEDLSRTKGQMSSKILGCKRIDRDDEFNIRVLDCITINKYRPAVDFFLNSKNHWYKRDKKKNEFKIDVAGIEHTVGWGGIHAAKQKYINKGDNCQIWHVDVASFYPRLMIFHNLLTRNTDRPERFKEIFDKRIALKRAGKKAEQAPLKIVINGTYGISKDKTSNAYDPLNANLICVNGQLMLIDLIEHLEVIDGFELIQSNTDGLIVSLPDTDEAFDQMDDICHEWEKRCNMELEFDSISWIYQKDVNNYVFQFDNGKLERKGSYVMELSTLDYDLPIVNEALINYMSKGTPIESTVNECDELDKFQKIVKLSNKYEYMLHNDVKYTNKCYRVFASKLKTDTSIFKCRSGNNPAKCGNTPINCFIDNSNIKDKKVPEKLDKQWYIDLAKKRAKDFGI